MRKFISTALGGAPVNDDDLLDVFNSELWGAIEALLSQHNADTQGIVVSGCATTANGGNFDMTAGIVYLGGEFLRVSASTNVPFPRYITPSSITFESRTFQDLTVNDVIRVRTAGLINSIPGSGQYLAITSLTDLDDRRWNPVTQAQLISEILTRANADATISGAGWQSISLSTSDIKNGGGTNPSSLASGSVDYRIGEKDIFIFIKLTGVVFGSAPSELRVLIPSALRTAINAALGHFTYPVPCVGTPNSFTLGTTPANMAGLGYYDNTNNEMNFKTASLLTNGWQDVQIANFGCQFFVKV